MMLFAALCIGLGVFYAPLYRLLPYPVDYEPYTGAHVVDSCSCCCSPASRSSSCCRCSGAR